MELSRILAPAILAGTALTACTAPPPPVITPTPQATPEPKPAATPEPPAPAAPTATAAAAAPPAAPAAESVVRMYPVAHIHSLLDVTSTEGGVELRLGEDRGAGSVSKYRYVPIVNGPPDLEQHTSELTYVNTSSQASFALEGKRPDLLYHDASGFRSAAVDHYWTLGANGTWKTFSSGRASGVGMGIFSWSKDRLIEWRG